MNPVFVRTMSPSPYASTPPASLPCLPAQQGPRPQPRTVDTTELRVGDYPLQNLPL